MNRIKDLRLERGLTQTQLGEMLGTTSATIQRLETGKRQLTQKWVEKISSILGVEVSELFGNILPTTNVGVSVIGEVQAGVWKEVDVLDEPRHPTLPIGPDPRYIDFPQYALLVQGTSMNKVFAPGSYIVCVPLADLGREPRDGDIVVVERRRKGMVETTVKRLSISRQKVVLLPESTDPRFQTPVEMDGNADHDEIAVTALVVGRYEQF
jgi:transcriptional regulator with XRE-family HTH domain